MSLTQLPPLAETLKRHGIFARKSFGQHFLLDRNIIDKIAAQAGGLAGVHVVEIGPGPGGLTRSLLAAGAASVTAIEMDRDFQPLLAELAAAAEGRLTVIQGDALKVDVTEIAAAPRKIVANLPYNIATVLLFQWLEIIRRNPSAIQRMTLMFQKEVAERIAAKPGGKDYGRLAVMSQFLCEVEYGFDLPPGAFHPPPKVHSAVISLTPRVKPVSDVPYAVLEKVVAAAFGQRRKMLRGALKVLGVDGAALCNAAGIAPERRAETLTVEEFCALAEVYGGGKGNEEMKN